MAFTDDKYYIQAEDIRGRLHVVYLSPDGYSGSATELVGTDDPIILHYGGSRDDEFVNMGPTGLRLSYIASDTTVFDEIRGDTPMSWLVTWYSGESAAGAMDGTEVWRGYLLTDEISHDYDVPHIVTLYAVDGLLLLDHKTWDPASETTRAPMIEVLADALGELTGHGYGFGAAANWHAYDAGAAVSGNSYARYRVQPSAWRDPDTLEYGSVSLACDNIAGIMGGQLTQARGKWRTVQRTLITGSSYTQQTYDANGTAVSTEAVDDFEIRTAAAPVLADSTVTSTTPRASETVRYQHGQDASFAIKNRFFVTWTGADNEAPDSWTEMDEDVGTAPNTGSIIYKSVETTGTRWNTNTVYACGIKATDISYATRSGATYYQDLFTVGIKQTSTASIQAGWTLGLEIKAKMDRITEVASDPVLAADFLWSVWIDGSSSDYYWDESARDWVSGSIASPPAASKNRQGIYLSGGYETHSFEIESLTAHSISDSGPLTVKIYGPINHTSTGPLGQAYHDNVEGVLVDSVNIEFRTGDNASYMGSTKTTVPDGTDTLGRPAGSDRVFFIGDGPTAHNERRITDPDGDTATGWKSGEYAVSESSSAVRLEELLARQVLQVTADARRRLRVNFRIVSGSDDYWQDRALLLDTYLYRCTGMNHSVRYCEYHVEAVETGTRVIATSGWSTYPGDWWTPGDQFLVSLPRGVLGTPGIPGTGGGGHGNPDDSTKFYPVIGDATSGGGVALAAEGIVQYYNPVTGEYELNIGSGAVVVDPNGITIDTTAGTAYDTAKALAFGTYGELYYLTPGTGQATYELVVYSNSGEATQATITLAATDTSDTAQLQINSGGTASLTGVTALDFGGGDIDSVGHIELDGATSGTATITAPAVAGTPTLTLPTTTGTLALTSDISSAELDTTLASSGDYDGPTTTRTAAENITAGDVCTLDSSGEVIQADASSTDTCYGFLVMAPAAVSSAASGTFLMPGSTIRHTNIGTGDPNQAMYVSETSGQLTDTAPTNSRNVGQFSDANTFYFYPSPAVHAGTAPGATSARILFMGGLISGGTRTLQIDYVESGTTGNGTDFGDLTSLGTTMALSGCSSSTRGIRMGGWNNSAAYYDIIDYVTIASIGNATDFGDLTETCRYSAACSNDTRGVRAGGHNGSETNVMDYITIASTGNATDFGDLTGTRLAVAGCGSTTRGVFGGGYDSSTRLDTIDYITIASTGNGTDFGNLTVGRSGAGGCSSATRGVFAGGYSTAADNTADYITIASTGDATDFGDLTVARWNIAGAAGPIRGLFGGGTTTGSDFSDVIDYITIASVGNATDFGDLNIARHSLGACSADHGGLA